TTWTPPSDSGTRCSAPRWSPRSVTSSSDTTFSTWGMRPPWPFLSTGGIRSTASPSRRGSRTPAPSSSITSPSISPTRPRYWHYASASSTMGVRLARSLIMASCGRSISPIPTASLLRRPGGPTTPLGRGALLTPPATVTPIQCLRCGRYSQPAGSARCRRRGLSTSRPVTSTASQRAKCFRTGDRADYDRGDRLVQSAGFCHGSRLRLYAVVAAAALELAVWTKLHPIMILLGGAIVGALYGLLKGVATL